MQWLLTVSEYVINDSNSSGRVFAPVYVEAESPFPPNRFWGGFVVCVLKGKQTRLQVSPYIAKIVSERTRNYAVWRVLERCEGVPVNVNAQSLG